MSSTIESTNTTEHKSAFGDIETKFCALDADDKLAVLWQVYDGLGESVIEDPDDNQESDSSSDLYGQLAGKSKDDQLQFMHDVISGNNNDQTGAYSKLSNTTKVALWYRLGKGMSEGDVVQVPGDYKLSDKAQDVATDICAINFDQKYIIMRDTILGGQS